MKAFNEPKPFINQCKELAKQHGWVGYEPADGVHQSVKPHLIALMNQIADRKVLHRKICNAFPNKGTWTFTDGVVDYVLGLLMQPTLGVMPSDQQATGVDIFLMRQAGYSEQQISAVMKERLKNYL